MPAQIPLLLLRLLALRVTTMLYLLLVALILTGLQIGKWVTGLFTMVVSGKK